MMINYIVEVNSSILISYPLNDDARKNNVLLSLPLSLKERVELLNKGSGLLSLVGRLFLSWTEINQMVLFI